MPQLFNLHELWHNTFGDCPPEKLLCTGMAVSCMCTVWPQQRKFAFLCPVNGKFFPAIMRINRIADFQGMLSRAHPLFSYVAPHFQACWQVKYIRCTMALNKDWLFLPWASFLKLEYKAFLISYCRCLLEL